MKKPDQDQPTERGFMTRRDPTQHTPSDPKGAQRRGLSGLAGSRLVAAFLVLALGIGWPVLTIRRSLKRRGSHSCSLSSTWDSSCPHWLLPVQQEAQAQYVGC